MVRNLPKQIPFPSKDEILAFINEHPGKVGAREIARAFNLKNDRRVELKRMLRELADEGHVESRRKKLLKPHALPEVTLADITGRDTDGELLAIPTEWDEDQHGPAPKIRIVTSGKARPHEIAGVGDRALLRLKETPDDDVRYSGRVIKIIDKARTRALGIFRALPGGGGRLVPVDKKQLGKELTIPREATKDAQDGDLIAVSVQQQRVGLPVARVEERLGSLKSERAVSLIAIHAHEIPHVFPVAVEAEAHAARPAALEGREDWRKLALVTIDPIDA